MFTPIGPSFGPSGGPAVAAPPLTIVSIISFAILFRLFGFLFFFLWELVKSNLRVAVDVVTPKHRMKPGVVAVPLDVDKDEEITLLANLISLTPGTLSLDVSDDKKVLYVHAMYVEDPEAFRKEVKEGFERRVKELLR